MVKSEALRKIEALHPEKDAWEIVRLSIYYEFPWDFNRALELALYKTYAVPSIAKILENSWEFERNTQKRYDDTDLLLSEIIENGLGEGRGLRALNQMNYIHSNYKISNEDYLYVLGTFMFEPTSWINKYGYRRLTSNEELAGFYVWKEIGEKMHIKDIPPSIQAFREYYDAFERTHFSYSDANAKVGRFTENLLLSWYLPEFLYDAARPFLFSVMQPHVLVAFKHREPGPVLRSLATSALRLRSLAASLVPRTQPFIRTRDYKHKAYPNGYEIERLGPEKLMDSPKCPYHQMKQAMQKAV